jgi:hypothetical protein
MNKQKARFSSQARKPGVVWQTLPAAFILGLAAGLPSYPAGAMELTTVVDPLPTAGTAWERNTLVVDAPAPAIPESAPAKPQYLPLAQLAEQYGIEITLIAVTGAGGLVDFRFKILDPDKARKLVGEPPAMPALMAPGSDLKLVTSHRFMHAIRLKKDEVSYALYPNVRGAVKPGTPVSVAFNGLRVEPVTAR